MPKPEFIKMSSRLLHNSPLIIPSIDSTWLRATFCCSFALFASAYSRNSQCSEPPLSPTQHATSQNAQREVELRQRPTVVCEAREFQPVDVSGFVLQTRCTKAQYVNGKISFTIEIENISSTSFDGIKVSVGWFPKIKANRLAGSGYREMSVTQERMLAPGVSTSVVVSFSIRSSEMPDSVIVGAIALKLVTTK